MKAISNQFSLSNHLGDISSGYLPSNQINGDGMGCDSICDLPDSLLTRILLNLPTKDSVKTSVLSKRWRNLWLSVPGLDLETIDFFPYQEVFERFMDRFMEFNRGSRLLKFDIMYDDFDRYRDRFMELIGTVVDCGIQHLHVFMYLCNFRDDFMRQNIYKSKTLVSLKLDNVELKNPEFTVSLPCLKILHLCTVCFGKDGPLVVEKLLLGCPVLEDLKLITPFDILNEQGLLFLHVRSQTLKRCCLGFGDSKADTDFMVEIDAPKLEYMSLSQSQSDSIVVKNLSSLFMLDIQTNSDFKSGSPLTLEDFDIFCDFLSGISSVRRMIISQETLEVLYCYSKLGPIPKFHNLYHLQVKFFNSSVQLLPALLESCPNLKNLVVDYYVTGEPEQINFTNVPRCLILTLENVEIKELTMKGETGIKVVNYFLENSAVLKKLTLSFRYPSVTKQEAKSYKKLLTSTKLSPTCQVIYKVRCL